MFCADEGGPAPEQLPNRTPPLYVWDARSAGVHAWSFFLGAEEEAVLSLSVASTCRVHSTGKGFARQPP